MLLIDNKDLFYSTQNCIQYRVIRCNGKNLKMKMCVCVCVCVTESLCCVPENNTTL